MYKTNKYIIIINGVILLNTSYYITFILVFKKTYKVYKLLLRYIKKLDKYFDIPNLNIILTNI